MKPATTETRIDEAAVQLGLAIYRLRARNRAESPGSNGSSFSQVSLLARIIEQEPVTANALAKSEHLRPQSVAETIAMLKAEGLIRTAHDPSDGRKVLLSATQAGRAAVDEATSRRTVWLRRAVEVVVGPEELGDLKRAIDLLNRLADFDTGSADRDRRWP